MSVKQFNIQQIALTTGGTENISSGVVANPMTAVPTFDDFCVEYSISGTQILVSNFVVAMTGTPVNDIKIKFNWKARCTNGAFSVILLGQTMPSDYLLQNFTITMSYRSGTWAIDEMNVIVGASESIDGDALKLLTVEGKHMPDATINYAKIQNVGAYSLLGRNAAGSGVISAAAIAAESLVGRNAAGFISFTPSADGQVIVRRAGALIAALLNFTELTGTLANAQIPDNEIALAKQQSTGLLYSKYTDTLTTAVTTEEVLATYTLPAATIAADGKGIRVIASGTTAANANTKTIRLKLGGTTYATNAVTTAPNASAWEAEFTILRSGAATAVAVGKAVFTATSEGIQRGTGTPTWANANAIEVTGQNGTASAGDITVSMVTIELLK